MSDIGTQTAFAKNFKEASKERHSPKRTEYLEQERAVLQNVMRLVETPAEPIGKRQNTKFPFFGVLRFTQPHT
jgi:hypothetical protein